MALVKVSGPMEGVELNNRPPPSRGQVQDRLVQLFCEIANLPRETIREHATVSAELQMESVMFVEIQVALQDEYDIELDPIHLIELDEFGAIVDYVHKCAIQSRI